MFDKYRYKYSGYSRPIPEMLDGEDWEVRNSSDLKVAYVDFKKREFVVPFTPGSSGELVRAHEAMHVKLSPRYPKYTEADAVTYQAVEDTRVNQALRIVGIPTDKGRVFTKKDIEVALDPNYRPEITPLRMGEAIFATKGMAEEEDVRNMANAVFNDRPVVEICDEVYTKYFGENEKNAEVASEEDVWNCVKELKERLKEISTDVEQSIDKSNENKVGKAQKNITESWFPGKTDVDQSMEIDAITDEELEEIKNALPLREFHYHGSAAPGKMTIETPRFDAAIKFKKVKGVKSNPSDEGVIPQSMHRYATDMRVFSRKGRRRTGAAVLIDVSGSMSLTYDEILNIIRQCPASIVAIYSGKSGGTGILRIVAEKGRLYTPLNQGMGGSNIIDLPALEWLKSRKEKKRLWISDGLVTGVGDQKLDNFSLRKVLAAVRDGRIERVGDVRELLKSGKLIDSAFDDGNIIGERQAARVVDSSGKTLSLSERF